MNRTLTAAAAALWLLGVSPAHADQSTPRAAVLGFNAAISQRQTEAMLGYLADGSVQLQLRAIHPGMSNDPPLTADLRTMWQTVAAILFPTTEAYMREIDITHEITDGEVSTVWSQTTTRTVSKGKAEPMELSFSEVYLLVRKNGSWHIAAIADNRQPDNIPIAPAN